jgi:putative inorganic carbon (hco3(-)) transporter
LAARLLDGRAAVAVPAVVLAAAVAYLSAVAPLVALAAVAGVVVLILVLTHPYATLLLLLAALPFEGLLGYPSETVSVVKLLGLLLLISFLISAIFTDRRLRLPPTSLAVGLFVLLLAVSLTFSPDPAAGTGKLLRYVLFAGFFFLAIQLLEDRDHLLTAMRVLTLSVTGAAIWGLVPFLQGDAPRTAGGIIDPIEVGYLFAALLPLAAYLMLEDRRWRWVWVACFPVILAGTLATLSRGALVALLTLLIWGVATRRIKLGGLMAAALTVIAVVGVAYLLWGSVIEERLEQKQSVAAKNVQSREALWRGAVQMTMDHPVTGVGPGRYGEESVDYVRDNPIVLENPATHNAYLEILAENGPFALAAFLAFLTGSWIMLSRQRRASERAQDRDGVRLMTTLQAMLLVAAVGALFLSVQLALPFWLIGALAAVAPRLLAEGPSPAGSPA